MRDKPNHKVISDTTIKLLVLDVDGTLTDGKIYYGNDGEVMKAFCVKDGYAIAEMLPKYGIEPIIITGRESRIVENRAQNLGIRHVYQGIKDKATLLKTISDERKVTLEEVAYIGDDLNDYAAMKMCGFKACPADAVVEIREICDYMSPYNGGHGAVRDVCEQILKRDGKYDDFLCAVG